LIRTKVKILFLTGLVAKFERDHVAKVAVPKHTDRPIHGLVSDKNFIVANAVENILAAPKMA
jgi:hypothetical protein